MNATCEWWRLDAAYCGQPAVGALGRAGICERCARHLLGDWRYERWRAAGGPWPFPRALSHPDADHGGP